MEQVRDAAAAAPPSAAPRARGRAAAPAGGTPRPARPPQSLPSRGCCGPGTGSTALPGVRWVKKMVAFPIGERFAAISITAALFTPRTTFVVLLAWGGVAAVYTLAGRVLRSIAR